MIKKWIIFSFALCFLIQLAGCSVPVEPVGEKRLWVVTEETAQDGMNQQVKQMVAQFSGEYPNITVQLDILPTEETIREVTLKQLRTKIMAGKGPDVFLLPSCNARTYATRSWTISEKQALDKTIEPLLIDPMQSMRNGVFMDISSYYDADNTLGKEALQQTVMDAGVVDGARYLLPLRYDFPVLYVDIQAVESMGIAVESLDGDILNLLDIALASKDSLFASGAEPGFCRTGSGFSLLPPVIDYDSAKVMLDPKMLALFLQKYQMLEILAAGENDTRFDPSLARYISHEKIVGTYKPGQDFEVEQANVFPQSVPITVGTLSSAPCAAAIAQAEKRQVCMIPLLAPDGTLTANVTYFGAVGAGCNYPREAYEFLRLFLLEENQWELNRPPLKDTIYPKVKLQYHPIEDGWPIRTIGSVSPIWEMTRHGVIGLSSAFESGKIRSQKIRRVQLTDADIPLLNAEIHRVYFGHILERDLADMLRGLNDPDTGKAQNINIDTVSEEFVKKVKWQLLEG